MWRKVERGHSTHGNGPCLKSHNPWKNRKGVKDEGRKKDKNKGREKEKGGGDSWSESEETDS